MDINQFYERLDNLFATGQADRVEELLQESKAQAKQEMDEASLLAILNEAMGFYRSIGSQQSLAEAAEALALTEKMGITGTVHEGTTLLNAATAYRAFAKYTESDSCYKRALAIYEKELGSEDYRLAGLYNNISCLYMDMEDFERATEALQKSLTILQKQEDTQIEQAVSLTNLTVSYLRNKQITEAEQAMEQALQLFEAQPGERDAHYGMALAGKAEIHFMKQEYVDAIRIYQQALSEIKRCYGESLTYAAALENCAHICMAAGYTEDAEPLLAHAAQIKEAMQ